MPVPYFKHGRRHLAGGEDPIPGGGGGTISVAGLHGTGIYETAPYTSQPFNMNGNFSTNDAGVFADGSPGIQVLTAGMYHVSAAIYGWDIGFVDTVAWIDLGTSGNTNRYSLRNDSPSGIHDLPRTSATYQLFEIFQVETAIVPTTITLRATSATEDFTDNNADHSLIVWRMCDDLALSGFD